jgi:hypothetical protein
VREIKSQEAGEATSRGGLQVFHFKGRSLVLMDQRQYDEARVLLDTAAVKYGCIRGHHFCLAQAYCQLARCLEELGDIKGALHVTEHSHLVYSQLGADWHENAQISALSVERLKVSWSTLRQPQYKYPAKVLYDLIRRKEKFSL